MRTGLTKKQKATVIYFDEYSRIIEVQTHNTRNAAARPTMTSKAG